MLEIEKGKDYEVNTKRFSFYKRLLAEFVYSGSYSFEEIKEKSILLLLNSSATAENLEQIESFLESYGLNL